MIKDEIVFFEIFPWNKNFETGIDLIDEQHKQLVYILNKLAAHLANRSGDIVLNDIFDELAEYADYHFKSEEKIWYEYFKEDEWFVKHEHTHGSFIQEVIDIKNNKDKKPLDTVVYDIVSFLSKWLAYHILDTDKRLAFAVKDMINGIPLEKAKIHALNEMNGSMKVIIETVLMMYDTLSTRTLDLMREKSLRQQAESALKKSEERWKFVLDGGVDNVWDWDIENDQVNKSENESPIFESIVNNSKNAIIHPADIKNVRSDFQAHLDGKTEFFANKHRMVLENGSWSWVLSRGKIVSRDKNGTALRMVGTHSDVTERELAGLIYHNSSQAIYVCDSHNTIISINPAFTKITGYSDKDIIGKNPKFLASGKHDKVFYTQMWDSINSTGHWSGEIYNRRKNGEIYSESLEINAVYDDNNSLDHYFSLFNDTTQENKYKQERQRQEDHLIQQSRMAQMGEMISMIAHQWRQPLSGISMTSMNIQTKIELQTYDLYKEEDQKACEVYFMENLQHIDRLVQNLSSTINDFRNFYKPNKTSTEVLINKPIYNALNIIKSLLKSKDIEIVEDYESDRMIMMYENEMTQVVLNILKNAEDNFQEKEIADPKITIRTKDNENCTILEIIDNGGGIPEEIITKIFDPYFSTKDEKNGTGLGLYMSKIIVEEHHNGSLFVSNKDNGACFTIEFKSNNSEENI